MGLFGGVRTAVGRAGRAVSDWARRSNDDVSFEQMKGVLVKAGLAEPTEEKPRGLFHDPYSVQDWGGWRQRPSALTYDTLRQMTVQNGIVAGILQVRSNQVSQFARPQQGPYDRGYRVRLRDRRDNRPMTKQEEKRALELERMIETTGYLLPGEKPADRDSFRGFVKKWTRDQLSYDQGVFELQRDRLARPSRFIMLPSETIRPAVSDVEHMDPAERRQRVSHVQIYEQTVIAEYGPDDLAWCIMNPRSDLRVNGFGYAPVEQMMRVITAWLYGFEANVRQFSQGSLIKGVLNVKGAIPDRQLRAFRRMWYSMVTGVTNAWRTPILNSEDVQWLPMQMSNIDMQFSAWMDWLTKIICAVFGIDPVELNFIFSGAGRTGAMFDRRPNQAEVQESKDKGLRPLMDFMADCLNMHLVYELAPDFEFSFAGFDAKAEEKEREARLAEVKVYKTVDQVRAEMNDPPLPDGLGEMIEDPVWLQWYQLKQAEKQMEENPELAAAVAGGGNGNFGEQDRRGDKDEDRDQDRDEGGDGGKGKGPEQPIGSKSSKDGGQQKQKGGEQKPKGKGNGNGKSPRAAQIEAFSASKSVSRESGRLLKALVADRDAAGEAA